MATTVILILIIAALLVIAFETVKATRTAHQARKARKEAGWHAMWDSIDDMRENG